MEFEYERGGALAYLDAWDVRRAKVFGRCESTTGIEPFGRLVQQVMEEISAAFGCLNNTSPKLRPRVRSFKDRSELEEALRQWTAIT